MRLPACPGYVVLLCGAVTLVSAACGSDVLVNNQIATSTGGSIVATSAHGGSENGGAGSSGSGGGLGGAGGVGYGGMHAGGASGSCADVCSDSTANPSDECGTCLLGAQAGTCGAELEACINDTSSGACSSCGDYHYACKAAACPNKSELCSASLAKANAFYACLCNQCGGGATPVDKPGFLACSLPDKPTSACFALDRQACLQTAGCRAILSDPCPTMTDCLAYPKFDSCLSVEGGTPASGSCKTLDAAACATRDDCAAVHQPDETNCCPKPNWAAAFVACRDQPLLAASAVCADKLLGTCLTTDGCRPGFELYGKLAYCGPFLTEPHECQACWSAQFKACFPSE